MRHNWTKYSVLAASVLFSIQSFASDNLESVTNDFSQIIHTLWDTNAMPLTWQLNENGVIDNGAFAVTNPDAVTEISAAFTEWQNVATSNISTVYSGETAVSDSGCDLVNIVTWSDSNFSPWPAGVIAIGLTTTYVGSDIVLNAGNRDVDCGSPFDPAFSTVTLDPAVYPDGMVLRDGTILDMDMTWNPDEFDYSTTPNSTASVFDIRAIATHEIGHLLGLSHTSMAFAGTDAATMFPAADSESIAFQNNVRSLSLDDEASSGRGYPDTGFWPDGSAAYTTGAISGWVRQSNGNAAEGVRVWAYPTGDISQPAYEGFTVHQFDWDPALSGGDYVIKGMLPGNYYVCILPWSNGVPTAQIADPARYNLTTNNGTAHTGFPTECYHDAPSGANQPDFSNIDTIQEVTVSSGETTPNINFVTGTGDTDIVLVMDRSGSMFGAADAAFSMTKLEALQNSAKSFIDFLELDGGHRLGLVQFNTATVPLTPVFDLQDLSAASKLNANDAIDAMTAGGLTNIISGVEEAVDQLTTIVDPNDRQIVFAFSDGKHNFPTFPLDVNDINNPIVNNDLTFYGLGFGTDVNSAEFTQVAANSGGLYVDHQSLDSMQLAKYFITIAASAVDLAMLVDPLYELAAGQSASMDAVVASTERDLTFTMNWDLPNKTLFKATVKTPSGCTIGTLFNANGVQVRLGETYRHIKIPMPYRCGNQDDHEGIWTINFEPEKTHQELTSVIVQAYSNSDTKMFTEYNTGGKQPVIEAKIVNEGVIVNKARFIADVIVPVGSTDDSYAQDQEQGGKTRPITPEKERTIQISFSDQGINGDRKAGDGIFTAELPTKIEGSYRIRTQGEFDAGKVQGQREQVSSYYFDGANVILPR